MKLQKEFLEEFKEFLDLNGAAWRAGKGDYEVIQVENPTTETWEVLYKSDERPNHFHAKSVYLVGLIAGYLQIIKKRRYGS